MRVLSVVALLTFATAAAWAAGSAPTTLTIGTVLPGEVDTTEVVTIAHCGPYGIAVQGEGSDSVSIYIDFSLDGTNWVSPQSQLYEDLSTNDIVHMDGSHTGRNRANSWWMRLRVVNESAPGGPAPDTLINAVGYVSCNPRQ